MLMGFSGNMIEKINPMTPDDLQEFKDDFVRYVGDEEGFLSVEDVPDAIKTAGWYADTPELEMAIREVDFQKTGEIDLGRYLLIMDKLRTECGVGNVFLSSFEEYDKDMDGQIGSKELKSVMRDMGEELTEKDVAEMIAVVDRKNMQAVDYEDFLTVFHSQHDIVPGIQTEKTSMSIMSTDSIMTHPALLKASEPSAQEYIRAASCKAGLRAHSRRSAMSAISAILQGRDSTYDHAGSHYSDDLISRGNSLIRDFSFADGRHDWDDLDLRMNASCIPPPTNHGYMEASLRRQRLATSQSRMSTDRRAPRAGGFYRNPTTVTLD